MNAAYNIILKRGLTQHLERQNSMKRYPSLVSNSLSASQEIPRFL
jgi:hypothetical protein